MKLIAGSVLILVFLDISQCSAPQTNFEEYYTDRLTSHLRGKTYGIGLNLGAEGGIKDGVAHVQTNNHLGLDVGEYTDEYSKKFELPMYPVPSRPSYNFGSTFDYPYEYYETYGSPYYMYGAPTYYQQYPYMYAPQYPPQYPLQYPPWYPSQNWQQYDPLYKPQYIPDPENSASTGTTNKPPTSSQERNEEDVL